MEDKEWIVQKFLDYMKSANSCSDSTVKNYTSDLKHFANYISDGAESKTRISESLIAAKSDNIRGYIAENRASGYSDATISRKISALRSFYDFLVLKMIINNNPLAGIITPKVNMRLPRYLDRETLEKLFRFDPKGKWLDIRDSALFNLLNETGIRINELVALNIDDIDLYAGVADVVGKGGVSRSLPISEKLSLIMINYIEKRDKRIWANNGFETKPLFLSRFGKRLTPKSVSRKFKCWLVRSGIEEDFSPNNLRHSFAVHGLSKGKAASFVGESLGNAKKITENNKYIQLAAESKQKKEPIMSCT